jgi:GntR family transcriptional regulator / MocR family aminotransferase
MWGIELNRQSDIPLKRQLYRTLRDWILNGRLPAGETLPSTRSLARDLKVSRNTVCEAYEKLIAEGLVSNHPGASTRVADGLLIEKAGAASLTLSEPPGPRYVVDFQTGQPELRQFPRQLWQKTLYRAAQKMPLEQFGLSGPQGLLPLREEISGWLFRSRGLNVSSMDIFITAGATQALHLIASALGETGQTVLVEDPCHTGMLQSFLNRGCRVIPVAVDRQGLKTDELSGPPASIIYITPSHQFPLGGILPAGRRAALVRFARQNGSYIVEDDYDSEFRYSGDPVAPLLAMDSEQVIYVGTFSKVLFPALRVGYVVLPRKLHPIWNERRTYTDVQNPPFEQVALADFLQHRDLDKYVRKMRRVYADRRRILLQTLQEGFGHQWQVWGDAAGLHLAIEFPGLLFNPEFFKQCLTRGLRIAPVENYCLRKGQHLNQLLIGYGHLEAAQIRQGVRLLQEIINHTLN